MLLQRPEYPLLAVRRRAIPNGRNCARIKTFAEESPERLQRARFQTVGEASFKAEQTLTIGPEADMPLTLDFTVYE